jgi:hypothetical protein
MEWCQALRRADDRAADMSDNRSLSGPPTGGAELEACYLGLILEILLP